MEFVRTGPGSDPIIIEGHFAATPETVFQAWTDPNIVMKWFGSVPSSLHSATIDLREGGTWQFLESKNEERAIGFEGTYLEIKPGKRLVFTWSHITVYKTGKRESTPYSEVEIIFTAQGGGTYVRLVHSAIRSKSTRRSFGGGWEFAFHNMYILLSTL